ncbi:hypothetical protein GCM10010394_04280 [Streptomyces crystallinus]|uniref:Uncharacterized protein n=1 Tax=Streptomyces crystallinus TaxID=68191 RepID=A0ABN1F039_9ACTN
MNGGPDDGDDAALPAGIHDHVEPRVPWPADGTPLGLTPNELRLVPTEELLSKHDNPSPTAPGDPDEPRDGGGVGGDVSGGDGGLRCGYAEGVGGEGEGGHGGIRSRQGAAADPPPSAKDCDGPIRPIVSLSVAAASMAS